MRLARRSQLPLFALLLPLLLCVSVAGVQAQSAAQSSTTPSAQAGARIPPAWNDAVARLASRIGNLASSQKTISMSVKNISSLSDADVAAISQALKAELGRLHFTVVTDPSADIQATVTFSEGSGGYVWVAEVRRGQGSDQQTEIVSVTKGTGLTPTKPNAAIVLDRKLVWQQASKFLDFALRTKPVGTYSSLIILEPSRLSFYTSTDLVDWQRWQSVDIPALTPKLRDAIGSIDAVGWAEGGAAFVGSASRSVSSSGIWCAVTFDDPEKTQCSKINTAATTTVGDPKVPGHEESDHVLLSDPCSERPIEIVTGNGDFTQPDTLQGYFASSLSEAAVPGGPEISFDGPVMALQYGKEGGARVVVHNLKTGNYEGYIVTATCGR